MQLNSYIYIESRLSNELYIFIRAFFCPLYPYQSVNVYTKLFCRYETRVDRFSNQTVSGDIFFNKINEKRQHI